MEPRVTVVALAAEVWASHPLATFVHDATVCERRIHKKSNLELERSRHRHFCGAIEAYAANSPASSDEPRLSLDVDYLDALASMVSRLDDDDLSHLRSVARPGATFFPPPTLAVHHEAFLELADAAGVDRNPAVLARKNFVETILASSGGRTGIGIVELHVPFQAASNAQLAPPQKLFAPAALGTLSTKALPNASTRDLRSALRAEFERALEHGTPVNVSNPPHSVITDVLHELVFQRGPERQVRLVYGDGSEPDPFPVQCLSPGDAADIVHARKAPLLRASLLSMRHPEMDRDVDVAWFINQQVSRPRPYAETDALCCAQTRAQLQALGFPSLLEMYQTGLQPAVVGFYRGLVEYLRSLRPGAPDFAVLLRYYRDGGAYDEGPLWCSPKRRP